MSIVIPDLLPSPPPFASPYSNVNVRRLGVWSVINDSRKASGTLSLASPLREI
jgi:hypothetical protein